MPKELFSNTREDIVQWVYDNEGKFLSDVIRENTINAIYNVSQAITEKAKKNEKSNE